MEVGAPNSDCFGLMILKSRNLLVDNSKVLTHHALALPVQKAFTHGVPISKILEFWNLGYLKEEFGNSSSQINPDSVALKC